jgi:hypothetical protein
VALSPEIFLGRFIANKTKISKINFAQATNYMAAKKAPAKKAVKKVAKKK